MKSSNCLLTQGCFLIVTGSVQAIAVSGGTRCHQLSHTALRGCRNTARLVQCLLFFHHYRSKVGIWTNLHVKIFRHCSVNQILLLQKGIFENIHHLQKAIKKRCKKSDTAVIYALLKNSHNIIFIQIVHCKKNGSKICTTSNR